jgi:hypothetical protein
VSGDPTVYTLTGMLAEMQSDTGRTATAQVDAMRRAIYRGIKFYQKRSFWFNETRDVTFSTVVGQDTYSFNTATTSGDIDAEFDRIDGCWVTFGSADVREMDMVAYDDMEYDADNQLTTGQPSRFAYINRAIRFDWQFDAIYTARLAGHIILAGPASDDEADNPWMTEGYNLIMSRAKGELYAHRWEDYVAASTMQQAEQLALKALTDATVDKLRTGFVTATEF